MHVIVFNPGGNSLKAGIVECHSAQHSASEAIKLVDLSVEGIGNEPKLSVYEGKKVVHSEAIRAQNYAEASSGILDWLDNHSNDRNSSWQLDSVDCACIRVVHGGARFTQPVAIDTDVEREISTLAKWAPLHNMRSLEILPALRHRFPGVTLYAVFDTAFHHTIPLKAGLYAIPLQLSHKHSIRRYGFHGISHRYLLERYAAIANKAPGELNLVTMHLESGCSVTAIAQGQSVDNTMGLTPLEGLMMGTRSGDVDPSLVQFLAQAERIEITEMMNLLEKQSGLLGVSGRSLDTRVLMRDYDNDERVCLALEMFAYRVLKAVGAYLAALGGADAIIFGGGIAENTPLVRQRICEGLQWCGLEMDSVQNHSLIDIEGRLSTVNSSIQAYVIPVEEILQIAWECSLVLKTSDSDLLQARAAQFLH
ncbi:MAG: acetate/propionate family kinase [Terracidiphilus sp.]